MELSERAVVRSLVRPLYYTDIFWRAPKLHYSKAVATDLFLHSLWV